MTLQLYMFVYICACLYMYSDVYIYLQVREAERYKKDYGVAMISRLLQIVGLFCRTSCLL